MLSRLSRSLTLAPATLLAASLLLGAVAQPVAAQSSDEAPDENTKMVHYSLYYEDFKAGNYADALRNLRWLLDNAPEYAGPGKADDRNFERAVVVYDSLSARAADETLARAYLDTAIALHDQVLSTLEDANVEVNRFKWTLDKGRFIQKHPDELSDLQDEALALYVQAYEMNPEGIDPYYVQILINHYAKTDKEKAVAFMSDVEERFRDNEGVTSYIAQVRNMLFRTPEERMEFLESQLAKNPEDTQLVTELFDIYQELGMRAKMYEIGERLMAMEPSADTYRIIAKLRLDDGEPAEAMELYEKAVGMAGNATARDYYNMGVAQQQMGSLSRARTYFRQALDVDPGFGASYIAIGDLYATAVSNCGSFEREDRAVYWLVIDYYNRAKNADAALANTANQKIRTYQRSFPDQEALFFKGWQVGQNYRIDYGCYAWIAETTTVKSP